MNELDLYKFITKAQIETRWDDDVLSAWLTPSDLDDFMELMCDHTYDSIDAKITNSHSIWIDLVPLCERNDIDPSRIVPRER